MFAARETFQWNPLSRRSGPGGDHGAGFVAFFVPGAGEAVGGALLCAALAARVIPAAPSAKLAG